jgi:hypothetical protein
MLKVQYAVGFAYIGVCALLIGRSGPAKISQTLVHPNPTPVTPNMGTAGSGAAWFATAKPFCNSVEVETVMTRRPPPAGSDGAGWGAACLALAGKVDRAREIILGLPSTDRAGAASILFGVGHPVADAGDDRSAGPIMALVVEFTPDNYMALYHAGMSEYTLGQRDLARDHLARFVKLYSSADGWRTNALEVLGRMGWAEAPAR